MDFEDLRKAWADDGGAGTDSIRSLALFHAAARRAETHLGRLTRGVALELAACSAAIVLLGSFLAAHHGQPRFSVPALLLQGAAVALAASNVRQLAALRRIDPAAPVVSFQRDLEALRIVRIRTTKWALLTGPLLWTPLLIVGTRALFGVDPYTFLSPAWLGANVLFGILVIAAALWASRHFAGRIVRSRFLRSVARDLAGHSLNEASRYLDEIGRIEAGEAP